MKTSTWLVSALLSLGIGASGCSDEYECGSQSVAGTPVEGCTDLLTCGYEVCTVTFRECDDDAPKVVCEGSSCTCFDGEDELATCDYEPDQCPSGIDVQFDGDDTEAMKFFESCCGVEISPR